MKDFKDVKVGDILKFIDGSYFYVVAMDKSVNGEPMPLMIPITQSKCPGDWEKEK
jgi:hypothetical protein